MLEKGGAVYDEAGAARYLGGFIINITRQKIMEEHFKQAQKMEAIGALAGGIAHDFNNILGGILGYSELLQDELIEMDVPEKMHRRVGNILKAGIRAKELVAQILAFSRSEMGRTEPVSVDTIAGEAAKLLEATLPSTIRVNRSSGAGRMVLGDVAKIHQIVMNLCTNAGHAMKDTGGVLSIGVKDLLLEAEAVEGREGALPGAFVRLTVEDTGHGMDRETAEKIMDPFFTTKPKGEGTGMGLWVIQGIIKTMGGFMEVTSEPGRGARFDVYLPVMEEADRSSRDEVKHEKERLTGNERILFVDDEQTLTRLAGEYLSDLGYRVSLYNSAVAALERFLEDPGKFDMVITDLTMPDMTGDVLCAEIKAAVQEIPVILATGVLDDEKAARLFDAVLQKPVMVGDMAGAIRKAFNSNGQGRENGGNSDNR